MTKFIVLLLSLFMIAACSPVNVEVQRAIESCYDAGAVPVVNKDGMVDCKCICCSLPTPINLKVEEVK
jgi:hypothetical protein